MDKNTKILLLIIFVMIICSVFLTYKRAFVDRDFEITNSYNSSKE